MDRNIGQWADLVYSVRFFCYLMEMLGDRLPDLEELEESYEINNFNGAMY